MAGGGDTIVAVSSPPGRSLRGLIRIAGPEARAVTLTLLADDAALPPAGSIGRVSLRRLAIPALLAFHAAPRSYTGDDLAELQVPGHPALLDRLIHAACAAGARLAEPGEFTFRAYAAGKLDLTQVEGVAATISATSDGQLRAARMLRDGKLGAIAAELVDRIGTSLALVEAGIDFVDQEDVVPIPPGELDATLADVETRLAEVVGRSRSWGVLEALPRVVLVGAPSAGKSTLFNALLGRQRAVVDAMPGTTRDVLAEPLTLRDANGRAVEVMLLDIAGLDRPTAALDEQVQDAAQRAIESADLVLHVIDRTDEPSDVPAGPGPVLRVATKADLGVQGPSDALPVSAHTGAGIDALRSEITRRLQDRAVSVGGEGLALQPRHEAALGAALAHLREARALLAPQRDAHAIASVELVAGALRAVLDELAGLGGQLTPDDVIGRVFATFCVGK